MPPLVTVCIPTYNGAPFLRDCLDSVLAQTFANFEVIIVDDCSSDETVEIARAYAAGDSRIQVSRNAVNLGLVGNWNRCIELSHGTWIKFVFQDDLILPECLSVMLHAAETSEVPIVSCARDFIFEPGISGADRDLYLDNRDLIESVHRNAEYLEPDCCAETAIRWIGCNFFGEPTAVLLHRKVFEQYGQFNSQIYSTCDLEYWIRVASNTGTLHLRQTLATFRVHQASSSAFFRQATGRRYRIETIDPMIIVHEFVFHPQYENLRRVAARHEPPIDLSAELWRRALSAEWFAKRGAKSLSLPGGASSPLDEWRRAVHAYPRLAAIPGRKRAMAKWEALKRTVPFWMGRRRSVGE